jgi:hypothetical protein
MIKISTEDRRLIGLLLTPSWISGLVTVVAALVISIGVIIAFEAHSSLLQQHLLSWQQPASAQPVLTQPGQNLTENDHPSLKSTWPLLLIWSLVGLLVYLMVASIVHSANQAEELRESLDYVNARPHAVLASTAEHIVMRVVAVILFIIFAFTIWHQVVPYSIMASHASASDILSLDGGLYELLSFFLIAISLHIETILLRLSLGRARVFSA